MTNLARTFAIYGIGVFATALSYSYLSCLVTLLTISQPSYF